MTKRIFALLMSLCIIFSMLPVLGVSATGTEAEFSFNSSGYQTSPNNRYLIYLDLAGITDVSATTVPDGSKVVATVNGSSTNLWAYTATTSQIFMIFDADLGNYLIEIDAGTAIGSYTVKSDLKIKIDEYTVTQLEIVRLGIDTTKGSSGVSAQNNGSNRYIFYLTGISGYSSWNVEQTLIVNGTSYTEKGSAGNFEYEATWFPPQALLVSYKMLTGDSTTALADDVPETTIAIPAGTIFGNCITENTLKFTINKYALTVHPTEINVESTENSGWTGTQYLFYLHTDISYTLTTAQALTLVVNDTEQSVWLNPGATPFLSAESTVAYGENKIVIPAGTKLGDCVTAEDYTFYTHADGSIDQNPPDNTANFTFASGIWQASNTPPRYLVYLDHDAGSDLTITWTPWSVLTVDGVDQNTYAYVDEGTGRAVLVLDDVPGFTEPGEHEVTLKKGTMIGNYEIANDVTFYTHADGTVSLVPATKTPVSVIDIDRAVSKHNGTEYHIYLNMSESAFVLGDAYNNTFIPVSVDGNTTNVSIFKNGEGSLLVTGWTNISLGYHEVTIPAGTAIGDYVLENAFSFRTYSNGSVGEESRGEVLLNNASAMMGGNYGDGLYYDLSGSFEDANWIVNAVPADGNITMEYVKISEAKDSAWYGPVRMVNLNNQWPNVFGVTLSTASTTFANEYGLTNMAFAYNADEHTAYFRNSAGNMQAVPTTYGYISSWDTYMTDNLLTSTDFAGIDEKGARYYGIGWGSSKSYALDWTKLMIYDAQGNDLGVAWYDNGANVTLTPMVEYGKTVYLKPADNNGLPVTGWKVMDLEGNQISVDATKDDNGIWSFAVPEDTMSIEPVYGSVDLTVTDNSGKVLVQSNISWLTGNIQLIEKQIVSAIPEGCILKGYVLDGALYSSLESLPVTDETTSLNVIADTLQFKVQEQTDIRHGETLDNSGLRFVATLGQTEYIPKVLLISDSEETLSVANAPWKVGNPFNADFTQIESSDGTVSYSIVLTDIPAADYNKTYYARAGVLVTYADGSQNYIYTDTVSATVNSSAQNTYIMSQPRTAYVNGVMNLDADAGLVGNYNFTITVDKASGDYSIAYNGSTFVGALTIDGQRFTVADGVVFGEDNTVTVPNGLFANAKLKKELTLTGSMDIGAYFGPSVGVSKYTESSGAVTDHSVKRTHDQVYADVEDYFNAGFNIWMAEDWAYGGTYYGTNDALSALDLAAEYCINHGLTKADIKVLITDNFINGLLDGTDMNNGDRNSVENYAAIARNNINTLINYNPVVNGVQVGTEYNCFAGYLLRDEPWYKHLKYYSGWFSFLAADETESATVTAWNTSGEEVSGEVSCMGLLSKGYTLYFSFMGMSANKNYVTDSTSTELCTEAEYVAYVKAFVDNVNATVWNYENMILAFDNYGLYSTASSSFGSTSVNYTEEQSENWQQNMSLFADLVQDKNPNATFATALRSFGMTRLSNISRWTSKTWEEYNAFDSTWGEQAISMQAYTALAHGYGYLSYFSYWETQNQAYAGETFTDACVMWDANMNPVKQNMYYWVQSANAELRQLEDMLSNFSYVETSAIPAGDSFYTGTGNVADTGMGGLWTVSELVSNTALASITASRDTTAGYFCKESGEFTDMFILVNMSHPNEKASDTVTMTLDAGYTGVIVYLDGVASIYQLVDGACTVTLPSGEGAIVIPIA